MTNTQTLHREMRGKMNALFARNVALISPHPDIDNLVNDFMAANIKWESLASKITDLEDGDSAAEKQAAIDMAAQLVTKWGQRCKVKARQSGNHTLEIQLDHTMSDFINLPAPHAKDLLQAMRNGLSTNMSLFSGQGLTPIIIADIDLKIAEINRLLYAPQQVTANVTTLRLQLAQGDADLQHQLEDIVDLLRAEYGDINMSFVTEMEQQYQIGENTGKRYTSIEGEVKDTEGMAMEGYTVRRSDDFTKYSKCDRMGVYRINGMRGGWITLELLDTIGDVVATRQLRVKLGQSIVYDWMV